MSSELDYISHIPQRLIEMLNKEEIEESLLNNALELSI